jgi:hypothetical protein
MDTKRHSRDSKSQNRQTQAFWYFFPIFLVFFSPDEKRRGLRRQRDKTGRLTDTRKLTLVWGHLYSVHCLLIMLPHSSEGLVVPPTYGGVTMRPRMFRPRRFFWDHAFPGRCFGLGKRRMGYKMMTSSERVPGYYE